MIRQKVSKRRRLRLASSVHSAIRRAVEADAKHFGVSMSFVQATALADHYGIDIEKCYEVKPEQKRNVIRFRRRA